MTRWANSTGIPVREKANDMADMTDAEYFGHDADGSTHSLTLNVVPESDPDTIYNIIIKDNQKEDKV